MAIHKIKIDLNYLRPNTSFIYPIHTEDGEKILDERIVMSNQLIANIKEKYGSIVYYFKNVQDNPLLDSLLDDALGESQSLLDEISHTEKLSQASYQKAEQVVEKILTTFDFSELKAVRLLKNIRSLDDYLFNHLVNVGILSALFSSKFSVFSDEDVKGITLGGYLIDIGLMKIDQQLIKKEGKYDVTDMMKMKRHPQLGYEMLKGISDIHPTVLQVVLFHHEKFNNNGYYSLPYENLPMAPKLVSICDIYDAYTSKRPYRDAFSPAHSLKSLVNSINIIFDYKLVHDFINLIGPLLNNDEPFFSLNDLCELNTNEIALIKEFGERNNLKPKVIIFCRFEKKSKALEVKFLNHPIEVDLAHDTDRYITKIITNESQIKLIKKQLRQKKMLLDYIE